jgi:hypothetical protein
MEQSPSLKANSHSARQEINHLLIDRKVHYQEATTGPYHEPDVSSPHLPTLFS